MSGVQRTHDRLIAAAARAELFANARRREMPQSMDP